MGTPNERCANCGADIGLGEEAHVYGVKVVCKRCISNLAGRPAVVEATTRAESKPGSIKRKTGSTYWRLVWLVAVIYLWQSGTLPRILNSAGLPASAKIARDDFVATAGRMGEPYVAGAVLSILKGGGWAVADDEVRSATPETRAAYLIFRRNALWWGIPD